ncbi:unnamed protein product [Cuscuta campestris]|uniref:Retrotransposon gag domain-containing protein n=1 Tax=Cuscuta campestris TaxID=132261 RepID=A0A484LQV8_9ASTE|nr:unnamed protein product [Cuscuta campestris]
MTLEQLLVHLRVREEGLAGENKVIVAKANVVEHPPKEGSSKGTKKDTKKLGPKGGVTKTKFAGKCYNYGISSHRSSECRKKPQKKKKLKEEALCSELNSMDLYAVVAEVNLDVAYDWWKHARENIPDPVPWAALEPLSKEEYVLEHFIEAKREEFLKLTQGEITLSEYRH